MCLQWKTILLVLGLNTMRHLFSLSLFWRRGNNLKLFLNSRFYILIDGSNISSTKVVSSLWNCFSFPLGLEGEKRCSSATLYILWISGELYDICE